MTIGIPVAQLGSVLDFDRNAREAFQHVLADQRRVPARAAGGDEDVVEPEQLLVGHVETAQLRRSLVGQQSSAHAVLDRRRLLEDLLEHEVVEPAALDLVQIPVDLADAALELLRALIENRVAVARQHRDIAVVEIDDFARLRQNRRDVAGDVVLAVAEADEKRAALPRRDDLVLVLAGDDRDSVGAFDLPEGFDHGVLEISVERLFDQVSDDFGIGLGDEGVAVGDELLLERAGVLDDSVVDDGDVALAVDVRVRVALVRNAVRRPAGVADSHVAGNRAGGERALQLGDLSRGFAGLDSGAVHHGDAGRVVAAVLHPLQPLEEKRRRAAHSDVANDSAHKISG